MAIFATTLVSVLSTTTLRPNSTGTTTPTIPAVTKSDATPSHIPCPIPWWIPSTRVGRPLPPRDSCCRGFSWPEDVQLQAQCADYLHATHPDDPVYASMVDGYRNNATSTSLSTSISTSTSTAAWTPPETPYPISSLASSNHSIPPRRRLRRDMTDPFDCPLNDENRKHWPEIGPFLMRCPEVHFCTSAPFEILLDYGRPAELGECGGWCGGMKIKHPLWPVSNWCAAVLVEDLWSVKELLEHIGRPPVFMVTQGTDPEWEFDATRPGEKWVGPPGVQRSGGD